MGWNYNWGDLVVAANLSPYVIYEEEIEKTGIPDSVKVVIAPDCPALLKSTAAALKPVAQAFNVGVFAVIADKTGMSILIR